MAIAVSNAKYAKFGVVVDFVCRYARLPDRICSVAFPNRFQDSERNRSFYCSQLIDEMYQHAGVDLTPGTSTMPDDIRVLSFANVLDYVGHLRGGG